MIVKTLIGASQIEVGLKCLKSLLLNCRDSIVLHIHDDGSLRKADEKRLLECLPGAQVISKPFADRSVTPQLRPYPRCLAYRERHPLALKLFDICLLTPELESFLFCDSDVYFFRPFSMHEALRGLSGNVFMRDNQEAYALYPWHVGPLGPFRVGSRVNTGFMHLHNSLLDLGIVEGYLEWAARKSAAAKRPQWMEQTAWAILSQSCDSWIWDPRQVFVAGPTNASLPPDAVAIHFVSTYRSQLDGYLSQLPPASKGTVVLRRQGLQRASLLSLALREIRSRVR